MEEILNMFKNAHFFCIDGSELNQQVLEDALANFRFSHPGSQDLEASGFVPPVFGGTLVYSQSGHYLLCMQTEKKLLPPAVIKRKVNEKAREIEQQTGARPGRSQLSEIKAEVLRELLPKAFSKVTQIRAWIDPKGGWFVVEGKPDDFISLFNEAMASVAMPAPVQTEVSPSMKMYGWLKEDAPEDFSIDDECELKSIDGEKATVKYARLCLDRDDVKIHLDEGKYPIKLAMTYDDSISFVLTEKLELKKLAFIDFENPGEDSDAIFEADFENMVQSMPTLFERLIEVMSN